MRGNPTHIECLAPASLGEALTHLAANPGRYTPIAGGTEIMVAHAAGQLKPKSFLNLWNLPELTQITSTPSHLGIGGGVTFTHIRHHPILQKEFPLLAQSATWIGAIANQNRATLAGNIVNASPAADAPPALLVYDAVIELISHRGTRRLPYSNFHLGYKTTVLERDELVLAIHLPRRFTHHHSYIRKVGTRRAMAVSKTALAATAIINHNILTEIRLAAASLADRPIRLLSTEAALLHQPLTPETIRAAQAALLSEARSIDDIRSTAAYRTQVAANLLEEFLQQLSISPTLAAFNVAPDGETIHSLLNCCSATRWAQAVAAARPFETPEALYSSADQLWSTTEESDWQEAFHSHPKIGERNSQSTQSATWSQQEQSSVSQATRQTLEDLARLNLEYQQKFGFTYIVCASGRTAEEMLAILQSRLDNPRQNELAIAAEEQRKITRLRLQKWLEPLSASP